MVIQMNMHHVPVMLYASEGCCLVRTQVTRPKSNSFSVPSAAKPTLSGFKSAVIAT